MYLFIRLLRKTKISLFTCTLLLSVIPTSASQLGFLSNQDGDIEIYLNTKNKQKFKQLTHNKYDDLQPCVGPNGKWLAYIGRELQDQYIRVINLEGEELLTINEPDTIYTSLTCMHSKNVITYAENKGKKHGIFNVTIPSNTKTKIYSGNSEFLNLSYAYDDKYLAFAQMDNRKNFLVLLDSKRKSSKKLFDDRKFFVTSIDWSPNAHNLVISAKHKRQIDLWWVDAEKNSSKQLTNLLAIDTNARFSPDGKKLAWLSARKNQTRLQLVVSDISMDNLQFITPDGVEIRDAIWSPEGKDLVYAAYTDKKFNLYRYSIDNKTTTQLSTFKKGFQIMPFFVNTSP